ncbi:MAG TPA: hypothetical protein VHX38_17415 [Pseudonocardiaceae bacterium]|jgi:hypothetical protein|nr:hypothetical protein [Pseudonocardiaceae bacterium]
MSNQHGNVVDDDVEAAVTVVKHHRKKLDKMRRKVEELYGELDEVLEYAGLSKDNRERLLGIYKEEGKILDQLRETVPLLEGLPKWLRDERLAPPLPPAP